mmetsp:Transcript_40994/g.108355  ORF Transcript_40994/g.108355 Transcript_40994/m.108355 type:complete len:100 (-) Transcript_40994:57-356(-)
MACSMLLDAVGTHSAAEAYSAGECRRANIHDGGVGAQAFALHCSCTVSMNHDETRGRARVANGDEEGPLFALTVGVDSARGRYAREAAGEKCVQHVPAQ